MIEPLTKVTKAGALYTRRPKVVALIEKASQLDRTTLEQRAAISDETSPDYLPSECLVYFVRKRHREANDAQRDRLLAFLLRRAMQNLMKTVPDSRTRKARAARYEILGQLGEMIAEDGKGEFPNELDYFEVNYNDAFASLRADVLRAEGRLAQKSEPLPDDSQLSALSTGDDDTGRFDGAQLRQAATQPGNALHARLLRAITALPAHERKAVTLVHILGYDEESDDPAKVTAATLCDVTGRTIRNWLRSAVRTLAQFKEEL